MKTLLTTFSVLALLVSLTPVSAESDGKKPNKSRPEWTPEIKERFQAARTKALQDPEIQKLQTEAHGANEKFFQAMRKKMNEIDPGLAEIVRTKREGNGDHPGRELGERKRKGPNAKNDDSSEQKTRPDQAKQHRDGLASLDDTERQTLKTAREKAQSDPAVQGALEKKQSAETPQDREAAAKVYRQAMHAAMLKADPSIEPILKKLAPKPKTPSASDSDQTPKMDGEMVE